MNRSFLYTSALKDLRHGIMREVSRMRKTADTSGFSESIYGTYIQPILAHYKPIISPLASHYGETFYRSRKCESTIPYSNISELMAAPIPSGRALSIKQTPILYASASIQTCLAEIEPKIGDHINLVGLKYTELKNRPFWFVGELASFYKSHQPSHYICEKIELHRPAYFPEEAQQSFVYQDALINEVFSSFSSPADGYALNQYLVQEIDNILGKEVNLAGMTYLSVKDAPGINFAVFGDEIESLEIGQLNHFKITDIDNYGNVAWKLLQNGSLTDTNINWKNVR